MAVAYSRGCCYALVIPGVHLVVVALLYQIAVSNVIISVTYYVTLSSGCLCSSATTVIPLRFHFLTFLYLGSVIE